MIDERTGGGDAGYGREELLARRALLRRAARRRRLRAAAALIAGIAILGAAAMLVLGGGSEPAPGSAVARRKRPRRPAGATAPRPAPPHASTAGWRPHPGPVPILEYHVLGPAPADAPYPDLYVTRPDFHRQMNWLDDHGYEAVTLDQVEDAWYGGGRLPPKPVVVSFDDGYRPQFTYALPELRRHGWSGVLNLKAEGSDLYDSNVEAMIAAGWELASHTIDHSDLTTDDAAQLRREVAGSRAILRREYGVPVDNFCYPSGRYDATVVAAVEAAGYRGAMTEIPGSATRDRPYELARYEILGSQGLEGLVADLGG